MNIIEIKNLHKVYDAKTVPVYAVNGINSVIQAGRIYGNCRTIRLRENHFVEYDWRFG